MISPLVMVESQRRLWAWLVGIGAGILLLFAGQISPILTLGLPFAALLVVAVMRRPIVGLGLLVASIPVQDFGSFGAGEASLTATRASLVLAVFGYIAVLTLARRPMEGSRLFIPFAALLAWMAGTAATAADQAAGFADLFRWTTAFLTLVIATQMLRSASDRAIVGIIALTAIAGALEAAVGSVLGLLGVGPASFQVESTFARAFGTFGRPNTFGGYLEMTLFPVLWLAVYSCRQSTLRLASYRRHRLAGFHESIGARRELIRSAALSLLLIGSSALMIAGVLASFSRGAWLGVAAGLFVSVVVALRRFWVTALAIAPIALLLLIAAGGQLGSSLVGERFGSILDEARPFDAANVTITPDNFAVAERMAHWQAGWRMFTDDPLTGVGAGNFNASYPEYFVRSTFRISQGHAHNFYIQILAENGLVGLVLYVTLALSFLMLALFVALRSREGLSRALSLGAVGSMSAVYLHNVFENLHVLNLSVQISLVWALALVAHRRWRGVLPQGGDGVEYSRR